MATGASTRTPDCPRNSTAKVGLALGSGSAQGLAHIGVLRAIEDAGIAIDFIAGTSMGALVGAVYAAGKLNELEATFQSFDWKKTASFFDVVLPKKSGLLVREHVQSELIEELPRPFVAVVSTMRRRRNCPSWDQV